jgi:hypothetical protein
LDAPILDKVAEVLKVSPEAIRNFNDEHAINIISNNFYDFHDNAIASAMNYQCSFNPIEKYVEAVEEIKKLYERLLQTEREKVALLERQVEKK